ncbi:MAG TPA: cytochrome-c oxidase, cbb3-type subunit III [Candidatus Paenalcaligenes intestinipullorum]|uniref:Cbb3-type cytochrome c oxidase subunit n=1 Tax=Candidatus Paenalcaligenes intestinipullorum TaxID=2838718 RepID=A0A9D2RHE1_9BURK|nr:cytochrome-c oxidase, cbb3-type subunit III [Candidatus Paenalcaligenes intestinipullorum]
MSMFVNSGWSIYIAVIALLGIAFCVWVLWTQRSWLTPDKADEESEHVWDGNITELNTTVPRWWTIMYIGLCVFALIYLVLYPGLGSNKGLLGFTSAGQVKAEQERINARLEPVYAKYAKMDITDIAKDEEARGIGRRLFLNNCAQCHGSDARGGPSFPNLSDKVWLYGGEPEQILYSITNGRHGIMPPHRDSMSPADASDIAQYIRSLNNLAHDPARVAVGKERFGTTCIACHGADAKGNQALGAPNLTDGVWLYGSSEAIIVDGILNGHNNQMPAQKKRLTEEQIRLLAGWVWGLSNVPQN